jgi:hypothetical protein
MIIKQRGGLAQELLCPTTIGEEVVEARDSNAFVTHRQLLTRRRNLSVRSDLVLDE